MQKQLTKKLYYRKYPYKVELKCEGASYVRLRGADYVINACEHDINLRKHRTGWRITREVDNVELHKFATKIKPFLSKEFKYRAEGQHFNFFLEDKDTFDYLVKTMDDFVATTWEPGSQEELEFLTSNRRKVVVDQLPYGKFTYKVVFKTNWNEHTRKNFLNWLKKYPSEDYNVTHSTLRYFEGNSRWIQDPFIYIREAKMLTMLQLFAGDNVKYAEEFVPRSTLLL